MPAIVYVHGGGFVLGNLDTHDRVCRVLASHAGVPVVAVDYRLSPEAKFPSAVEEVAAVASYLREQGAFLHAVLGSGGDVGFGSRLRDSLCPNLVQSVLHERYRNDPEPFVGYYVAFFASAYLGVITRWIETGMRESSEEMALIAMRLFFIKPGESIKL